MIDENLFQLLRAELLAIDQIEVFDSNDALTRFSKDAYNYSPILQKQLSNCCADLVVTPYTVKAVQKVASVCVKFSIPLTLRGSGTGNYGQSVPLMGGVVMLMNSLKSIRKLDLETGIITAESGCLLGELDSFLRENGRQLRLAPSTWRSASLAGFIAGGSGGIGSVRWGFLRDPGHLIGLEVVTLQDSPEIIQLDSIKAEPLNHAYGTNGIITALSLSTAAAVDWHEVAIDCDNWANAVDLLNSCSKAAIDLYLCTLLERKIVKCLPTWSGEYKDMHRLLMLVAPDGISTLERLSMEFSAHVNCLGPEAHGESRRFRELSWNHTTLHMRAHDSSWTYLQMMLPQSELEVIDSLNLVWGDDLCWHLESVHHQGQQRVVALPLVRWRGPQKLEELINQCRELGALVFNPHVITVEDGGLGVIDGDQVEAKYNYDPNGILNPGKLKGWIKN